MSSRALLAYRAALRAARISFQQDNDVLLAARKQIRDGFEASRNSDNAEEEIVKMNEISKFLVLNIVQGEKQGDGKYFLKFHDQTELGDNETIKQNHKANMGSLAGAKAKCR